MSALARRTPVVPDDNITEALADLGLTGWKGAHVRASNGRSLTALWTHDYDPLSQAGRMVAASGSDLPDALARSVEMALAGRTRPQPKERLH
ncbi:MAG: hypothetical protein ACT6TH_14455 [Brevundimonas sp.]|uniref:hypothetical protein n=1 Tax=Brevundimonas sp. TaxID=1871086 RepID=UPI004033A0CF